MEYGYVYSFVGRRSTTAETTAAAAHLGVTTYMFFSHIRTRFFSEGFYKKLKNVSCEYDRVNG